MSNQLLVAGVDSSTQSCKVLIRDVATGLIVRQGSAKHPGGTEVSPEHWWVALNEAIEAAGGLADVAAISVGGQQHGMVVLDSEGRVIRDALLWNDTRSATAATDLIAEFGADFFAEKTGSVPVASFTITKLRWLRDNEPENAAKVAAVALPHDWLSWRLLGFGPNGERELGADFEALATDRSDASGTGYFNSRTNQYEAELFEAALGKAAKLPKVLGASEVYGKSQSGLVVAAGGGDNAMAAFGLGASAGDAIVSIGTSGTVFSVSDTSTNDATGSIAGFADCSGRFLPITVTLNAAKLLANAASLFGDDFDAMGQAALQANSGSEGLVTIPFFEGERTPNLPTAKGSLHGVNLANFNRDNIARSTIEGMLCGLEFGLSKLKALGVPVSRIKLIGGGAQNPAVQQIAAKVFGGKIEVPEISEYVAQGATRQAAWALTGNLPDWQAKVEVSLEGTQDAQLVANYRAAVEHEFPGALS